MAEELIRHFEESFLEGSDGNGAVILLPLLYKINLTAYETIPNTIILFFLEVWLWAS